MFFEEGGDGQKIQNISTAGNVQTKPQIPPTNSRRTALLWQQVLRQRMSNDRTPTYRRPTVASQQKVLDKKTQMTNTSNTSIYLSTPPPIASDHTRVTATSTVPTSVSTSVAGSSKIRLPKLADKDFRGRVFKSYGIQFEMKVDLRSPYEHFNTKAPSTSKALDTEIMDTGLSEADVTEWYQKNHRDCNIWLSLDKNNAEDIAQQYNNMTAIGSNEAKFSYRAKLYFFREDKIYAPSDGSRCSSSYCELEWAPVPDDIRLIRPPLLDSTGETFSFNTNPDCTYWLTTRRMNIEYRDEISNHTFVLPGAAAASPYLTIEFKERSTDFENALNQLAVSATLALYNRFRLRCKRLRSRSTPKNKWRFEDIKHYGIAFNGSEARFYLATPVLSTGATTTEPDNLWQGCRIQQFRTLNAVTSDQVLKICAWTNEIHNWGLGQHSIQFQADIKGILCGEDESARISLLPEELAALG